MTTTIDHMATDASPLTDMTRRVLLILQAADTHGLPSPHGASIFVGGIVTPDLEIQLHSGDVAGITEWAHWLGTAVTAQTGAFVADHGEARATVNGVRVRVYAGGIFETVTRMVGDES